MSDQQTVSFPVPMADLPAAGTLEGNDYYLVDSGTLGTRRILADRLHAETLKLGHIQALSVIDTNGTATLELSGHGRIYFPKASIQIVSDFFPGTLAVLGNLTVQGNLEVTGDYPGSAVAKALEARVAALEEIMRRQGHMSYPTS